LVTNNTDNIFLCVFQLPSNYSVNMKGLAYRALR